MNNKEYQARVLEILSTMKNPTAEPNIYKSEADGYLEKMRAQHQAARERLGITEEFSFEEQGE